MHPARVPSFSTGSTAGESNLVLPNHEAAFDGSLVVSRKGSYIHLLWNKGEHHHSCVSGSIFRGNFTMRKVLISMNQQEKSQSTQLGAAVR